MDPKDKSDLDQLTERLHRAKKDQKDSEQRPNKGGRAMGLAYRMAFEMVIAVMVGTYLGWLLDEGFATKPLFMILMFFMGVAAGILNVFRVAKQMQDDTNSNDETTG